LPAKPEAVTIGADMAARLALLAWLLGLHACASPPVHEPRPDASVELPMLVPIARSVVAVNVLVSPAPRSSAGECPKRVFDVSSMRAFEVAC
jgi:hypothetical protein